MPLPTKQAVIPWTVRVPEDWAVPASFTDKQLYTPASDSVTLLMISPSTVCRIRGLRGTNSPSNKNIGDFLKLKTK